MEQPNIAEEAQRRLDMLEAGQYQPNGHTTPIPIQSMEQLHRAVEWASWPLANSHGRYGESMGLLVDLVRKNTMRLGREL